MTFSELRARADALRVLRKDAEARGIRELELQYALSEQHWREQSILAGVAEALGLLKDEPPCR